MCEEPIPSKNLWFNEEPLRNADVDEIYGAGIARLVSRGSYTRPRGRYPGRGTYPANRTNGSGCATSGQRSASRSWPDLRLAGMP
jgi:hypothetical protein